MWQGVSLHVISWILNLVAFRGVTVNADGLMGVLQCETVTENASSRGGVREFGEMGIGGRKARADVIYREPGRIPCAPATISTSGQVRTATKVCAIARGERKLGREELGTPNSAHGPFPSDWVGKVNP